MPKILIFLFFTLTSFTLKSQITFKVKDQTACNKQIFVAGNFNGWNPKNENFSLIPINDFHYFSFHPTGKLEFKFTQGSWEMGEGDSEGNQISNRILESYSPNDTIELSIEGWEISKTKISTASNNVKVDSFFVKNTEVNFHPEIWVYLPKSYASNKSKYPVLYLLDGQNLFDETLSYSGEWGVDEILDTSNLEVLIVGIANGGINRMAEYSPWLNKDYNSGAGVEYSEFIVDEVKPYIEKQYKASGKRKMNFIGGSSLGALLGHYAAFKNQNIFGGAINFSPAFWFNPEVIQFTEKLKVKKRMKFYFASGEEESKMILDGQNQMIEILRKKKVMLSENLREGENHNEQFWQKEFLNALKWLLD